MGLVSLLAMGARAYARSRSQQQFQRTYRELSALETPPLVSATAPGHALLVEDLRQALRDAAPPGWTVAAEEDMTLVTSAEGPQLRVEVEAPGCSSRRGRSAGCTEPSYWLIAPVGPTITVLRLAEGEYVEQARDSGETFTTQHPFAVTVPLQPR